MANKYERIDMMDFEDEIVFCDYIAEIGSALDENDYESIVVYCNSELAHFLFVTLAHDYDFEAGIVDYACADYDDYCDTYLFTICGDNTVSVEKAYGRDGKVLGHDANLVFCDVNSCGQDIIDKMLDDGCEVTLFDTSGEEHEMCDGDCANCPEHKEESTNDDMFHAEFVVDGKKLIDVDSIEDFYSATKDIVKEILEDKKYSREMLGMICGMMF